MKRCAGTVVAELPTSVQPAFLISDLHVPADGGEVLPLLRGVLLAAATAGARLFVLGDLFDTYICPAQVGVGAWREVAAEFAAANAAGVEIHLLRGNRDFLLGDEFAGAARCQLATGGLQLSLAGRQTVLLHGDELCTRDLPYQRAKRWLRHPLVVALARRLPLRLALRVAAAARARSQRVIRRGDQDRFLPPPQAYLELFASGGEQVVHGHIHRSAQGRLGGGQYWVLPAFDATGCGLWAGRDGIQPVRFGAAGDFEVLPAPGALPGMPPAAG